MIVEGTDGALLLSTVHVGEVGADVAFDAHGHPVERPVQLGSTHVGNDSGVTLDWEVAGARIGHEGAAEKLDDRRKLVQERVVAWFGCCRGQAHLTDSSDRA